MTISSNTMENAACEEAHDFLLLKAGKLSTPLRQIIEKNGVLELPNRANQGLKLFLARTIVGQPFSTAAASSVWRRIELCAEENDLSLNEMISPENKGHLLECGISRAKASAISEVADLINKQRIAEGKLRGISSQELSSTLTQIKGVGQWTADMTAIFYFGHPDVWSDRDGALSRGVSIISSKALKKDITTSDIANEFTPYRSYLSVHIWRAMDSGTLA